MNRARLALITSLVVIMSAATALAAHAATISTWYHG